MRPETSSHITAAPTHPGSDQEGPGSAASVDEEVGRARRYPAAAASLILIGLLLLLTPKLVASLFSAQWFGVPAGLVFIGLSWIGLIALSWISQHVLAPLILDRQRSTTGDSSHGEDRGTDA